MPCLRIDTAEGWLEGREAELFAALDAVVCRVLGVPPNDTLIRLNCYPPARLCRPATAGPHYCYVEVALFAGRTLVTKRALYEGITEALVAFGAQPDDVTIALLEIPLDNWGIRGGQPASECQFGFSIAI